MPRTIRFHFDEHITHALAQGRVIFTEDDDLLALAAAGVQHAGLAYCHQTTRSIGQVIRALELIWDVYEPHEMKNWIEFI